MPLTKTLELVIGNYNIDLGNIDDLGFKLSYVLEEPENFLSKQGADAQFLSLPATINNDAAFNTFWNPQINDAAPSGLSFRDLMPCVFNVNGTTPVLVGYAGVEDATGTDKPEQYNISVFGSSGSWVIDLQNVTLWDCVNPNTHTFDVATVEGSWTGFGTTADHDFVYAPVRYRQPFDGTTLGFGGDNCVNIYHLRPSISLLRLIERAFNSIGFQGNWQVDPGNTALFFNTNYAKNIVLPWVWGDFYDINSQLTQGLTFQACGSLFGVALPPDTTSANYLAYWYGDPVSGPTSSWRVTTLETLPGTGGVRPGDYNVAIHPRAEVDWGIEYITNVLSAADLHTVNAGTGYTAGDVITLVGLRGTPITVTVATVGGGGNVLSFSLGGFFGGDATSEGYAAGKVVATTGGTGTSLTILILKNNVFTPAGTGGTYIFTGNTPDTVVKTFDMSDTSVPNGYDDLLLYSFDPATGTMTYAFNVPPSLMGTVNNIGIQFLLSMYSTYTAGPARNSVIALEIVKTDVNGHQISNCYSTKDDGYFVSNGIFPATGDPITPTAFNFTVPNCNNGDTISMRLVCLTDNTTGNYSFFFAQALYLNNNPSVLGVPSYTYNPVTESFGFITPNKTWSPLYSKMTMTGFLIQLGNNVNLQDYDAFRNYQVLDMLGGVIDMFNLEVQTDNINKVVTMEPMFGSTLPTGETIDGYFSLTRILDYSAKQDNSQGKGTKVTLFKSANRQLDLTFKLDGNDGSQNIWAQRYKGIYLNDRTYTGGIAQNNINIDNGIIAGIPGAARYMLPNRFAKGNQQLSNRFFSPLMHATFPQWIDINGTTSPAPQLPCIFSGNTNSDTAYKDVFTPKLAWYAGQLRSIAVTGGWLWIGDPATPSPITSAPLPFMFSVNYGKGGSNDPILSYCDESTKTPGGGIVQSEGLLSQFYRSRFALMRNGQLVTKYLRLSLSDICNWTHQECVIIDGCLYALIQIDGYNPLNDDSVAVTMWKIANVQQVDIDNSFPSAASIATVGNPATPLGSNDLRYAKLLLYSTDMPQIG